MGADRLCPRVVHASRASGLAMPRNGCNSGQDGKRPIGWHTMEFLALGGPRRMRGRSARVNRTWHVLGSENHYTVSRRGHTWSNVAIADSRHRWKRQPLIDVREHFRQTVQGMHSFIASCMCRRRKHKTPDVELNRVSNSHATDLRPQSEYDLGTLNAPPPYTRFSRGG